MWIFFAIAVLLIILFSYLVSPKFKGFIGEKYISFKLKNFNKKESYVIDDIVLFNENDSLYTSQIDHIYISKKGIFSIETKNYSGYIYGDDYNSEWTQTLNYGKVKNKFYSPVMQNQKHCNNISNIFNNKYIVNNIVIFIRSNIYNLKSTHTFKIKSFEHYLKQLDNVFNEEEVKKIYGILSESKKHQKISSREHVKLLKNKITNSNIKCPDCNGKLIIRKGRYGSFYGCSNYPNCKYTKSI